MTRPIKYIAALFAALSIGVGAALFWPSGRQYISERQQQTALEFYEKNLTEGMTRGQVQTFIDNHQSQQLSTLSVHHPAFGGILVALGEVPSPLYCRRRVAYLRFNFNAMQRDTHGHPILTAIDNFSDVQLLQELQDCL